MSPLTRAARQTFKALRVRNYRLFFVGQIISASGTWMHAVALGLLVLSDQLHGNGFNVGLVTALQFLPMLLLGSWGGLIVDRVDKRRLLYVTQSASGVLALALGILVARETDDVDRRVVRVKITAEGRRNLQRIRSLKNAYLNRRLAALDPAEQQLAESMTSLLEHLVADE